MTRSWLRRREQSGPRPGIDIEHPMHALNKAIRRPTSRLPKFGRLTRRVPEGVDTLCVDDMIRVQTAQANCSMPTAE